MKNDIIKQLANSGQITEFDSYVRSKQYKGFWLSDNDAPLLTYEFFEGLEKKVLKSTMLELRNDGLVELMPAIDYDGNPNGSGWSLTYNGLVYAVENKLIEL